MFMICAFAGMSFVLALAIPTNALKTKIFILEIRINLALLQSIATEIWNNTLFDVIRCWCCCARTPTTAEGRKCANYVIYY